MDLVVKISYLSSFSTQHKWDVNRQESNKKLVDDYVIYLKRRKKSSETGTFLIFVCVIAAIHGTPSIFWTTGWKWLGGNDHKGYQIRCARPFCSLHVQLQQLSTFEPFCYRSHIPKDSSVLSMCDILSSIRFLFLTAPCYRSYTSESILDWW